MVERPASAKATAWQAFAASSYVSGETRVCGGRYRLVPRRDSVTVLAMRRRGLILLLALWMATGVSAQPIYDHLRIIAPAAPGGGWDQTARAMQQALQTEGIVKSSSVENIAGAAGTIGLARLISAERGSGNVAMISGLIMLGAVVTHRSPVTLSDVTPIARLTGEYEAVVVPAQSPYRTLGALIDAFRARPESISWGGGSAGGTDQILAGLIADAVGVSPRRVNYIAFSGGGESMSAILGGQVTAGISGLGEYASQLAAGTLRILAISSAERLPGVDAPTLREAGVDVVLENWRSLVGPPDMSAADRARLERAVEAMVASPAWREMLQRYRWNDRYLAGEAFERFLGDEEARVQCRFSTNSAPAPFRPRRRAWAVIRWWSSAVCCSPSSPSRSTAVRAPRVRSTAASTVVRSRSSHWQLRSSVILMKRRASWSRPSSSSGSPPAPLMHVIPCVTRSPPSFSRLAPIWCLRACCRSRCRPACLLAGC